MKGMMMAHGPREFHAWPAILRLYVGDHHVQPGETHRVENGQMVCFARDESGSHVHFLKFQAVGDPTVANKIMVCTMGNHMGNHMGSYG